MNAPLIRRLRGSANSCKPETLIAEAMAGFVHVASIAPYRQVIHWVGGWAKLAHICRRLPCSLDGEIELPWAPHHREYLTKHQSHAHSGPECEGSRDAGPLLSSGTALPSTCYVLARKFPKITARLVYRVMTNCSSGLDLLAPGQCLEGGEMWMRNTQ